MRKRRKKANNKKLVRNIRVVAVMNYKSHIARIIVILFLFYSYFTSRNIDVPFVKLFSTDWKILKDS